MKPKSFIFKTQFVKVSFLLIASFLKKIYILAIGYKKLTNESLANRWTNL